MRTQSLQCFVLHKDFWSFQGIEMASGSCSTTYTYRILNRDLLGAVKLLGAAGLTVSDCQVPFFESAMPKSGSPQCKMEELVPFDGGRVLSGRSRLKGGHKPRGGGSDVAGTLPFFFLPPSCFLSLSLSLSPSRSLRLQAR